MSTLIQSLDKYTQSIKSLIQAHAEVSKIRATESIRVGQQETVCIVCANGMHDCIDSEMAHGLFKCDCACNQR